MNINISNADPEISLRLIMIDIGDISKMIGYTFKIIDFLGKVVYESIINRQVFDLDPKEIGGRGTYYVELIDDSSQIVEINKIVLR